MADRQLTDRVAALMRAGGWREVKVTAPMGRLGTDVVGVAADGRRWLIRCHSPTTRLGADDVRRFASSVRQMRRGDVVMMAVAEGLTAPILDAAAKAGVTLVDGGSLSWWAALQSPGR